LFEFEDGFEGEERYGFEKKLRKKWGCLD